MDKVHKAKVLFRRTRFFVRHYGPIEGTRRTREIYEYERKHRRLEDIVWWLEHYVD
jgi:hypothetical protein